jgi:hypothetical protein
MLLGLSMLSTAGRTGQSFRMLNLIKFGRLKTSKLFFLLNYIVRKLKGD